MLLANFYHSSKDIIPGLLTHHHVICKHATIPADMFEGFGKLSIFVTKPVARIMNDVKFTVWISSLAMTASFVVRARAKHGAVVLGNVKIYCPRAKGFCNCFEAF